MDRVSVAVGAGLVLLVAAFTYQFSSPPQTGEEARFVYECESCAMHGDVCPRETVEECAARLGWGISH